MFGQLLTKIVGTQNDREIKRLRPRVAEINALEDGIRKLSDEQLRRVGFIAGDVTFLDGLTIEVDLPRRGRRTEAFETKRPMPAFGFEQSCNNTH